MSWQMIIQLLVNFGPKAWDLITALMAKWNSTDPVTEADIAELRKLGERSSKDAVVEALIRANIPLDSDQAKSLLALVP